MLEPRCPTHPGFTGDHVPGQHGLEERGTTAFPAMERSVNPNKGSGSCADCWEKFRQVQAKAGNPGAR